MSSSYAWKITKDHTEPEGSKYSEVGTAGPYDAPAELLAALEVPGNRFIFRMYDDDRNLYYTGFGTATPEALGSEEFAYGPLNDFGTPNAGAVTILWQGHKEWDCG